MNFAIKNLQSRKSKAFDTSDSKARKRVYPYQETFSIFLETPKYIVVYLDLYRDRTDNLKNKFKMVRRFFKNISFKDFRKIWPTYYRLIVFYPFYVFYIEALSRLVSDSDEPLDILTEPIKLVVRKLLAVSEFSLMALVGISAILKIFFFYRFKIWII